MKFGINIGIANIINNKVVQTFMEQSISIDRWIKFSFAQQMGNIGSEISRARHWEEKNDEENRRASWVRTFELVDLTLKDSRWKSRLRELTRFREVMGSLFCCQDVYQVSTKDLENYCTEIVLGSMGKS